MATRLSSGAPMGFWSIRAKVIWVGLPEDPAGAVDIGAGPAPAAVWRGDSCRAGHLLSGASVSPAARDQGGQRRSCRPVLGGTSSPQTSFVRLVTNQGRAELGSPASPASCSSWHLSWSYPPFPSPSLAGGDMVVATPKPLRWGQGLILSDPQARCV